MKRHATKWLIVIATLITAGALAALSRAYEVKLDLSDAWVRPTLGAGRTTAAYVTIHNAGSNADRLVAVSTPNARAVEIHTSNMEDGVMRMRRVESLRIKNDDTVSLAPGGLHIMIFDLAEPIEAGDTLPLTLSFEKAGDMTLDAIVTLAPPTSAQPSSDNVPEHMPEHSEDHSGH